MVLHVPSKANILLSPCSLVPQKSGHVVLSGVTSLFPMVLADPFWSQRFRQSVLFSLTLVAGLGVHCFLHFQKAEY